jgi:hypothetical protein
LDKLSEAQIADIKRKGTVVIKDVVDDDQARAWKTSLEEFVKANPQADGLRCSSLSGVIYVNRFFQESRKRISNSSISSMQSMRFPTHFMTLLKLD